MDKGEATVLSEGSIPSSANFPPGFTLKSYKCRNALLQWYGRQSTLPKQLWPDLFERVDVVLDREPDETDEATYLALWEKIENPSASPRQASTETKPRWDKVRLCYGEVELRNYQRKAAPEQAAILEALERAGWPTGPVQLPEACGKTLNKTLHHLNAKINNHAIVIRAGGDGKSVLWQRNGTGVG